MKKYIIKLVWRHGGVNYVRGDRWNTTDAPEEAAEYDAADTCEMLAEWNSWHGVDYAVSMPSLNAVVEHINDLVKL